VSLAPYARIGSGDNVVAVRVDHSREADSRWYTGSGIYRHVRLRLTNPIHITQWGTFVTTPQVGAESAVVHIDTTIENGTNQPHAIALESMVMLGGDTAGDASTTVTVPAGGRQTFSQDVKVDRPRRWQLDSPTLYALHQFVRSDSLDAVDQLDTAFGVRTIRFDAAQGFFLNDQPLKIRACACITTPAFWARRSRCRVGTPVARAEGDWCQRHSHQP
jgi:beta-galactosidase